MKASRILILITVFLVLLSFAACAKDDNQKENPGSGTTGEEITTAQPAVDTSDTTSDTTQPSDGAAPEPTPNPDNNTPGNNDSENNNPPAGGDDGNNEPVELPGDKF